MVLHEYYFENMKKQGTGDPQAGSAFVKAADESFGSYDVWKADFVATGKMRGVGWAATYQDPSNGAISNHWIDLHETGNVAGLYADPDHGRVGTRLDQGLRSGRQAKIYRSIFLEYRLGHREQTAADRWQRRKP